MRPLHYANSQQWPKIAKRVLCGTHKPHGICHWPDNHYKQMDIWHFKHTHSQSDKHTFTFTHPFTYTLHQLSSGSNTLRNQMTWEKKGRKGKKEFGCELCLMRWNQLTKLCSRCCCCGCCHTKTNTAHIFSINLQSIKSEKKVCAALSLDDKNQWTDCEVVAVSVQKN